MVVKGWHMAQFMAERMVTILVLVLWIYLNSDLSFIYYRNQTYESSNEIFPICMTLLVNSTKKHGKKIMPTIFYIFASCRIHFSSKWYHLTSYINVTTYKSQYYTPAHWFWHGNYPRLSASWNQTQSWHMLWFYSAASNILQMCQYK